MWKNFSLNEESLKEEIEKFKIKYQESQERGVRTEEFIEFSKDFQPKIFSFYEKACKISSRFLNIKPDKKSEKKLIEHLEMAHINTTPSGVMSFAVLFPFLFIFVGILLTGLILLLIGDTSPFIFFSVVIIIFGVGIIFSSHKSSKKYCEQP